MWEVAQGMMLMFLGISSIWDIRTQQVPAAYLLGGTVIEICWQVLAEEKSWHLWGAGFIVGCVFLIFSKYTKEGIGYADSWMILNLGIFLGVWQLSVVLLVAFWCAAVASGIGMLSRKWNRKTKIAFLPFLTLGYVGALLW